MKTMVSGFLVVLTCGVVMAVLAALAMGRFELCDETPSARPPVHVASAPNAPSPTPAPRPDVVTIQVQADKPDLEVGWAN
jgi:hypothetical protein